MDLLNAMRMFVRVVELGSFSRAAAELHVKPSAVSRAVSGLEAELNAGLFHRTTRQVRLTEPGRAFYQRAVRVLREVEDARRAASGLELQARGRLRLQLPAAFGRLHVMPHVPDFLAAYPEIELDLGFTDIRVDLIAAGADAAIRIGPMPDSSLIARRLAPHRRLLCASPAYLARAGRPERPEDLLAHDCLVYSLQPSAAWYFAAPGDEGHAAIPVHGPLRADDSEPLREMALAGLGVVLLPSWLVGADIAAGRLVRLLPGWSAMINTEPSGIFGIHPPPHASAPQKVRVLFDFLRARFGRPPYWDLEHTD